MYMASLKEIEIALLKTLIHLEYPTYRVLSIETDTLENLEARCPPSTVINQFP